MADEDLGTAKGRIEIDTSSLNKVGGALTSVGKSFIGVGGAMVAGFALAVDAAATFEQKISGFKAVSGATEAQLESLRQKALELGSSTIYSADQIADGFISLGKAGLTAEDVLNGAADATIQLSAAAEGLTLDQSAEIIANTMKTFNLTAADSVHIADELAGAANKSTLEVQDLATSFRYAGPVADTLGISLDDVATSLAILGDRGIKGSTAGTSLRGVLLALSAPTTAASKELKELGLITEDGGNLFFDASGKMKSMADVAQLLQDHTAGLSEEQKVAAFSTIFQRRAMASALVIAQAGAAGFDEYNTAIQGTSAADVAGVKLDNLSGDVTKLKNSFKTFLIEAGGPFQQSAREFVGHLQSMLDAFKSLTPEQQKFILQVLLYGGAFLVALGTMSVFAGQLLKMIALFKEISTGVKLFKGVLFGLEGAPGLISKISGAFGAMNAVLAANPVILIILAIIALIALGVLLYKKWQPFHDLVDNLWTNFQKGLDIVKPYVMDFIKINIELFNTIKDKVGGAISFINDVATSVADGIRTAWQAFQNFRTDVADFFTKTIPGWFNTVVEFLGSIPGKVASAISSAFSAFLDFMDKLPGRVGYAIGFIIGRMLRFAIDGVLILYNAGKDMVEALISFLIALPGRVWDQLVATYNFMTQFALDMWNKAIEVGTNVLTSIINFFTQLPGNIWNFLIAAYNFMTQFAVDMWNKAIETGTNVVNSIIDFFGRLPGIIGNFFRDAFNTLSNIGVDMFNKAKEIGSNVFNGIKDGIVALPGEVSGILGKVIDAIKGQITSAFNAVKDFASGLWNGFKDGLGIKSPSYIEKATTKMTKNVGIGVDQLKNHIATMRALANPFAGVSNQLALTVSSGQAKAIGAGQYSVPGSNSVSSHTEGDTFIINEAKQKTPMEISREIATRKRLRVHG